MKLLSSRASYLMALKLHNVIVGNGRLWKKHTVKVMKIQSLVKLVHWKKVKGNNSVDEYLF